MTIVRIADVIVPEIFTQYTIQETMELSELIKSGIATNTSEWDALASGASNSINMPYWEDLKGDPEVMNDTGKTTPGKITTNMDIARKMGWTKSFGANALSGHLAGSDPMKAISGLFASYWSRFSQQMLLSQLDGVFASSKMADKVHDISTKAGEKAVFTGRTALDAVQKMGDAKDALTGIMIHSAVENHLAKNNLIEYIQESEGKPRIKMFMGKRVVVDDGMPFDNVTSVGVAYLFGEGAIAWGNGSNPKILQTEIVRDGLSLAGEDVLVNRRLPLLHPRGIKWTEKSVADVYPNLAELANGTNWERVYEPKAIRIVKFVFKID